MESIRFLSLLSLSISLSTSFDLSVFHHRRFSQFGFSSESVGRPGPRLLHLEPSSSALGAQASPVGDTDVGYHFQDKHRLEPQFDPGTARNVTIVAGKTAYLPCRVRHLGDRTVSWIRRADLSVLTVGKFTYTGDERFKAVHVENSDDWHLEIRYPQKKDAGVYECQLSTMPKRSIFVSLNVVISSAKIFGGPSIYSTSGATLQLTCIVSDAPLPPDYIFWHHNGEVINYDSMRSVKLQSDASKTTSTLSIAKARPTDSGNYTCVPSNAEVAHIAVHVLNNGGSPAAMQHGKRSAGDLGSGGSFLASCACSAASAVSLLLTLCSSLTTTTLSLR